MEYTVTRSMRGELSALTKIDLGVDRRVLRVETSKRNRGISTSATVVQVSEDGLGFSYMMFQDYSKTLAHDPKARATEKNIRAMHESALAGIDAIVAECKQRYGAEAA